MDNNNPQDPNTGFPPPATAQPGTDQSSPGVPGMPQNTVPGFDQPQPATGTANPWDAPIQSPSQPQTLSTTPPEGSAWPSSANPGMGSAPIPMTPAGFPPAAPTQAASDFGQPGVPEMPPQSTVPALPGEPMQTAPAGASPDPLANPMASNPFLQGQPPAQTPANQPAATDTGFPQAPAEPAVPEVPVETPTAPAVPPIPGLGTPQTLSAMPADQAQPQDPLGTAFAAGGNPAETNPFAQSPADQAPAQTPEPGASPIPGAPDLSVPPANNPAPENPLGTPPAPAGNALPEIPPQENAPTDLSHLIAGDEGHQQPGDIYNPPVASDQNLPVNNVQTPAQAEGSAPPPGKHLNITKVLLIAGIPVILIVAALSAYLILGIGKASPPAQQNQTSLPIQQASPAQAPLTNPPAQIVPQASPSTAPSQATGSSQLIPLPSTSASSPSPSLSPAMQAAQRASASPKASASPAASSTTTPQAIP